MPPSAVQTGPCDIYLDEEMAAARRTYGASLLLIPSEGLLRHQAIVHAERSSRH